MPQSHHPTITIIVNLNYRLEVLVCTELLLMLRREQGQTLRRPCHRLSSSISQAAAAAAAAFTPPGARAAFMAAKKQAAATARRRGRDAAQGGLGRVEASLTAAEFYVLREKGTEPANSGRLTNSTLSQATGILFVPGVEILSTRQQQSLTAGAGGLLLTSATVGASRLLSMTRSV